MFYRYELDPEDDLTMDFDDLLKKATRLLGAKKKVASSGSCQKEGEGVEDLVDNVKYETRSNRLNSPFILAYQPLIVPSVSPFQISGAD